MIRITDDLLRPTANNLTLTRLILASSVIYTHSYAHFARADVDDLLWLLGSPVSHYGVDGFFMLSGFLVYRSLVQNSSAARFLRARLTRLLPGMALMLLILVFAGAFVTAVPLVHYMSGSETLRFVAFNLSLLWPAYTLTGVSCHGGPCGVNESLWTLPWEARCYLLLIGLSLVGLAGRRAMLLIVLPLTLVSVTAWSVIAATPDLVSHLGSGALYYAKTFNRLWPAFALGIFAYEVRRRIPLSWLALAALFLVNVVVQASLPAFGIPMRQLFIGYFVLCIGFLSARRGAISAKWPDYSYGMYIYGFPVMLAFVSIVPVPGPHLLALASVALTVPFAAFSWHVVEKPALDWLRRRQRSAYKATNEPDDIGLAPDEPRAHAANT